MTVWLGRMKIWYGDFFWMGKSVNFWFLVGILRPSTGFPSKAQEKRWTVHTWWEEAIILQLNIHTAGKIYGKICLKAIRDTIFPNMWSMIRVGMWELNDIKACFAFSVISEIRQSLRSCFEKCTMQCKLYWKTDWHGLYILWALL